jgi:hypothetical protein
MIYDKNVDFDDYVVDSEKSFWVDCSVVRAEQVSKASLIVCRKTVLRKGLTATWTYAHERRVLSQVALTMKGSRSPARVSVFRIDSLF